MSSENLGCILVKGVPDNCDVDQVIGIISKGNLPFYHYSIQTENDGSKTWILQVNLQDAVELCDNIKRKSVDVDDGTLHIVFEWAQTPDIPHEWIDKDSKPSAVKRKSTVSAQHGSEYESGTRLCHIKITDLPEVATDKDYLELYFEEKENFHNYELHVESIKVDERNRCAIIKFAEPKDAETVIEMKQLYIENTMVSAMALTEKELNALCTVEVRGPKDIVSEKNATMLRMYFQNTNRSAGGKIVNSCIQAGVAYFTFETDEERVAARDRHILKDHILEVKQQIYSVLNEEGNTVHNYTIMISPIPENVNEEYLILYFEQEEIFGESLQVEAVKFNEHRTAAAVVFTRENSVSKALTINLNIEKQKLDVEVYNPDEDNTVRRCTIAVTGTADMISEKNLRSMKTYFQNFKLSGGGSVMYSSIKFGVAYFIFVEEEVAKRVVERGNHSVRSQPIKVALLQEDLHESLMKEPHSSTIQVSGLSSNMNEDFLRFCVENTSGIPVKSVKMGSNRESALVEFEQFEGVDTLIHQGQLRLKNTMVKVSPAQPGGDILNTIEVRGKSSITNDMDTLEQYFQSERHSGGGKIINCYLDSAAEIAYFTFENEQVASRVAEREHAKSGLQVKLSSGVIYQSEEEVKMNSETADMSEEIKSVKVIDTTEDVLSTDILALYFENEERSGGGKTEMIRSDDVDEHVTYVTFQNANVAKEVAERQHNVHNHTLFVSLYSPPPFYDNKILIKRLAPTTSKEALFNFLEARTGIKPSTMTFHTEEDDVALVTMESEIDFDELEKACHQRTLEGAELQVSRVAVSNCIQVDNLAANTTHDTVRYYFENLTKTEIDHVTMDETSSSCVVCFKDYKVIDAYLGHTHNISGKNVSVKRYFICINGPGDRMEERIWRKPNSIQIKDTESYKIKFCISSAKVREEMENELKKSYIDIAWPSESTESIWLNSLLDSNVPHCFKLAAAWTKDARKAFYDIMKRIDISRIKVPSYLWENVRNYLREENVQNPECVTIILEQKSAEVVVVGQNPMVTNLEEQIKINIKRLENAEKVECQHTKDVIQSLQSVEIKHLKTKDIFNVLKRQYRDLELQVDDEHNDLILEGPRKAVRAAKLQIENMINDFASTRIENISYMRAALYRSKETLQFIQGQLEANCLNSVWDVEGKYLVISCAPDSDVEECERIILTSVVEKRISYERGSIPVLETEESDRNIKDIEKSFRGKVEIAIHSDTNEVVICATKDVCPTVLKEVDKYLYSNKIVSKRITRTKELIMLIDKYYKKELLEISQKFQKYHIQIIATKTLEGFDIRGLEPGIEKASAALEHILHCVNVKTIMISRLGVTDYVTSAKGKDSIQTIEGDLECTIRVKEDVSDAGDDINKGILARCKVFGNRHIYAWIGDMTENLEVDALIIPQDQHLRLHGTLGTAILSKGGHSIQQACVDRIENKGQLREDECFISGAGDMDVKFLVHMISPEWENGVDNERERLSDSIFDCLQQADHIKRAKSIAIPAIGCGNNMFPVDISTMCIVQAVDNFFSQKQNSNVTTIYLCDMKLNTVYSFAQSLVSVFGQEKVYLRDVTDRIEDAEGQENSTQYRETTIPQKPSGPRDSIDQCITPVIGASSLSDVQNKVRFGNLNVYFVCGEIGKQQVNAIVNSTSANLDLRNGGVSKSLLDIGGEGLQREINANYPNGIKHNEIAVTKGHRLTCDVVLHVALGDFGKNSVKELNKIIKGCLDEVQRQRYSSVAFPALGTGILGFPRDIVAKEMFRAASEFSSKHSNSSVKDVCFVVHHRDSRTIQAFQQELANIIAMGDSTKKQQDTKHNYKQMQQSQLNCTEESINMFGDVLVSAKEGDLTTENVDCIVNSTNLDLDFATGAVSQVLKQKCGQALMEQITVGKAEMRQKQLLKTGAPGLPCKFIIHIDGLTTNWQKTVEKCLKEADRMKMTSIAIPALGAGLKQFDVPSTAHEILNGVREFANSQPHNLKDVRFLLLDTRVLEDYRNAIKEACDQEGSPGLIRKLISGVKSGVKHAFGISGAEKENVAQMSPIPKQPDVETATFVIYAASENVIEKAAERLQTCFEKEIHTKTFDDIIIRNLEKAQISEIKAMAKQHRVNADIDKIKSMIKISGISENVYKAATKVQSFISDATQMDLVSTLAQWYVIYKDNQQEEVVPYDKVANLKLERNYKKGQRTVSLSNTAHGPVVIDFEVLEEYPEFNKNFRSKVLRRDLITDIGSFAFPSSWGEMEGNLKVVDLQVGDRDFKYIESEFIECSGPVDDYRVIKIERIQNKTLWEQYQSKKKQLEGKNKPNMTIERQLWHGTKQTAVDSINAHGFNRSFCGQNATLYGAGVYFDTGCAYACGDTYSVPDVNGIKRVYNCRVLTGEYTVGDPTTRCLPHNPKGGRGCIFDSVVDNVKKPGLFVIFHDSQAYPEYLVTFQKKS